VAQFYYQAVNGTGARVKGSVEAVDRRSAITALTEKGNFVSELNVVDRAGGIGGSISADVEASSPSAYILLRQVLSYRSGRVRSKDVLAIITQLSTALRAGLPLLNCLGIILEQQKKPATKNLLTDLSHAVSSGNSLSEAMEKHPHVFSRLCRAMIRVGETGGIIEATSTQLAQLLKRDEQIKANMKNASAYPLFVLSVGLLSVIVVVTWILPKIIGTIIGGAIMLPWPTRLLLAGSGFLKSYGYLLIIAMGAGGYFFKKWIASSSGRVKWDSFKLRLPVFGNVSRSIAVGRFARTLGALTKGGVTILEALSVVRDTLGNELLARQIDDVGEQVKVGKSLAESLGESRHFPELLVQIISVGEQTGKLDELLLNAAETFDSQADAAINRFMAVLPAVLILLLALVVGFIVAATLLPIVVVELSAGGI